MMILNDNEPEAGAGFQYAGCQDRVLVETMRGLLLSLPTFGLYWCWAANRLRRHLWSSLRVLGGALEYRGSGAERLRGLALFVVSHVAFLAALLLVARLAGESAPHPLPTMIYLCFGLALLTLVPAALYRARRYRLRCTSWRGMTADLEGSGLSFALLWTL
ncbi:MAG: DUF898 domain-containing protein, partial [Rhodospirillales bacterium]|nr:DUF898 domain-containing protein [Rhodospirillales bacterium]